MRLALALLLASCTIERTVTVQMAAVPPPPPAQVLAIGVSLLWHDGAYVHWSVWVGWQEEGGRGSPCHTDYVPCRAPWGGPFSLDQCARETMAAIQDRYHRQFGLPMAAQQAPTDRAWWWRGDPLIEPLLRVPALGAPEW